MCPLIDLSFGAISLVAALLVGPAFVVLIPSLLVHIDKFHASPGITALDAIAQWLGIACMSNLVDALCLLLLILIMAILLAHRLAWPLLKRPIYAANRKQLIKNTKLLGTLGTMLLLYAFPNNSVVKWITHFLPNLKGR